MEIINSVDSINDKFGSLNLRSEENIINGKATNSDLEQLDRIASQIEGHCICALGDAAAWPIQGIIRHFRPYIEERIDNYKGDAV